MTIQEQLIESNGIKINTALAGPPEGEPVILLHGFPEAWFGWENQIHDLAREGYHVIAPDQRGYNLSAKPSKVEDYQTKHLINDVLGLADSLGLDRFNLAGHDWGAIIAWSLAMAAPHRVKKLFVANVPHPDVFQNYLRSHPSQMMKSWYMFFFQLPGIPERFIQSRNWNFFTSLMPDSWEESRYEKYRSAWSQPGALTGMINWYRANLKGPQGEREDSLIAPDVLIVWGKADPHLSWQMAELSLEKCRNGKLVFIEDATHWVQHDKSGEVSQLMINHFTLEQQT